MQLEVIVQTPSEGHEGRHHQAFFLVGIHSMQGLTATARNGDIRKRSIKRLKDTRNQFRKNLQLKDVC